MKIRDYQKKAVDFTTENLKLRRGSGLILAPGLGKTLITLLTIQRLKPVRVLITAPARVLEHWKAEAERWGIDIPVFVLKGSPGQRLNTLRGNFHGIFVVSHNSLDWLEKQKLPSFTLFVVDESSKFRNWSTVRTKAARRLAEQTKMRLILTGTPCPNHEGELYPQQYIMDLGDTLGRNITEFRNRYMHRGGYENREWIMDKDTDIAQKVAPYLLRLSAEYLDLPEIIHNDVVFDLPPDVSKAYKTFENDLYTEFKDKEVIAMSGSDKYRVCRQFTGGGYYGPEKEDVRLHDAKVSTLGDILAEIDEPTIIAYQFRREYQHICERLGHMPAINGDTDDADVIIRMWKSGEIKTLCVQSQAVSHGIDGLQHGGKHLIWFSLTDSCEIWEQLIARLHRSGQKENVIVHYLLARGTIDIALRRMINKKNSLQQAVLEYFEGRENG